MLRGGPQAGAGQRELQDELGPGQGEVGRSRRRPSCLSGGDDGRAGWNGPERPAGQPGADEHGHFHAVGPQHAEHDGAAHVGRHGIGKQHGGIAAGVSSVY